MKILCKFSGLEFAVQHFPFSLESREVAHPVFYIPQPKLISAVAKKFPDNLSPIDSYLGFLAILHSTGKIDWKVPCIYTPEIDKIIAQNMEGLLRTVTIISAIHHPAFQYPGFVITPDTRSLATVKHWIGIWQECIVQFQDGNKKAQLRDRIVRIESVMERFIKDPSKNPANYANQLANWAALAGEFPTGTVPVEGKQVALSEYWKSIIKRAARAEAVFSIDDKDLAELIEHCEEEIDHGSIYAFTLMKVLREAQERKKNFLGLGDFDIRTSTYRILSDADTTERANILAMIDSAPLEKPLESNYPSKVAYLRALYKWKAAQAYAEQTGNGNSGDSANNMLDKLGEA
jgi:hypothetical protein